MERDRAESRSWQRLVDYFATIFLRCRIFWRRFGLLSKFFDLLSHFGSYFDITSKTNWKLLFIYLFSYNISYKIQLFIIYTTEIRNKKRSLILTAVFSAVEMIYCQSTHYATRPYNKQHITFTLQEAQLSLGDRATRACQLKSCKVLQMTSISKALKQMNDLQGHSRSLSFVPYDRSYMISY